MQVLVYYMFIPSGSADEIKSKLEAKRIELQAILGVPTKIIMMRRTAGDDAVETIELDALPPLAGTTTYFPQFTVPVYTGSITAGSYQDSMSKLAETYTTYTANCGGIGAEGTNVIDATGKFTGL